MPGTNRLSTVTDAIAGSAESWDAESGSFTYDANGNMLTAPAPYGVTAAFYDHRNLPLLLTANGVMSAYRYDEQGQRISKRVTTSNLDEFSILDGRTSLGVVTVDGAGNAVSWTWNVVAGDKVVGRETQTAQRFYYHTDLLGTTRAVVQAGGGMVVEAYDYDPWGVRLDGRVLAGPTKEGFTTKERDAETGLDYFGARWAPGRDQPGRALTRTAPSSPDSLFRQPGTVGARLAFPGSALPGFGYLIARGHAILRACVALRVLPPPGSLGSGRTAGTGWTGGPAMLSGLKARRIPARGNAPGRESANDPEGLKARPIEPG